MKIKKFSGKSLKEVTELMRTELGDEAIILHTKNIPNNGTEDGDLYEITAAADDDNYIKTPPNKLPIKTLEHDTNPIENLRQIAEKFQKSRESKKSQTPSENKDMSGIHDLRNELDTVKGTLGEIAQQLKTGRIPSLPKNLQTAYEILLKSEVDQNLASDILIGIFNQLTSEQFEDISLIDKLIISKISEYIPTVEPLKANQKQSKVIAFIGPTGVGKTTTICKIAAVCKFFNRYNVAIISADTYRIAAIDQLKTFANIANITFDVAYSPEELADLVSKNKDKDVIFIDTVGRNHKNAEQIKDLERYINTISPDEVHLIISTSTSMSNMKEIVSNFGILKPNRLIFSKVDESNYLGPILNLLFYFKIPLSYLTTGQSIPDDIAVAESLKLASMIYKNIILES